MSRVDSAVVTVGLIIRVNEMKDPSMPTESQGSFNPEPTPFLSLRFHVSFPEHNPALFCLRFLAKLIVAL